MCFYIANARFEAGADGVPDFAHPEGPLIRILTPVPFESLAVAEAALRALLVDLEDRAGGSQGVVSAVEARETMRVWGEFPIVLWNSHEPDRHVVYDNLFNSGDPSVAETANHFVTQEFNRLADERRALDVEDDDDLNPIPASRFTVRSLPEWDRIDILSKYVATIAVEHFIEHPEDPIYIDPLTGVSAVESLDAEVLAELRGEIRDEVDARVLPSRRGDPSSLRVRGE